MKPFNTSTRLLGLLSLSLYCHASQLCVQVNDPSTLPLRAAIITVTNLQTAKIYSATTNQKGNACFSRIPEGLYSVESGLTGFLNVRYYPITIRASLPTDLTVLLPFGETHEGGIGSEVTMAGTVRQGKIPLTDAEICVWDAQASRIIRCVPATDEGEYAILLPPGTYLVRVKWRGVNEVHPFFAPNNVRASPHSFETKVVLDAPGYYHDLLIIPENAQ